MIDVIGANTDPGNKSEVAEYEITCKDLDSIAVGINIPPFLESSIISDLNQSNKGAEEDLKLIVNLKKNVDLGSVGHDHLGMDPKQAYLLQIGDAINRQIPFHNQEEGINTVQEQVKVFKEQSQQRTSPEVSVREDYINKFDCKLSACVACTKVRELLPEAKAVVTKYKGSYHLGTMVLIDGKQFFMDFRTEEIHPQESTDGTNDLTQATTESFPRVSNQPPVDWNELDKVFDVYDPQKPEDLIALDTSFTKIHREIKEAEEEYFRKQKDAPPIQPYVFPKQSPEELAYWLEQDTKGNK